MRTTKLLPLPISIKAVAQHKKTEARIARRLRTRTPVLCNLLLLSCFLPLIAPSASSGTYSEIYGAGLLCSAVYKTALFHRSALLKDVHGNSLLTSLHPTARVIVDYGFCGIIRASIGIGMLFRFSLR